jgi:multidrug resistance protein, MATE family
VWGPRPIRLGFIGAPIATSISFSLISIMSICYGIFLAPKTAWYPLSSRMFKGLGVLVQLGLSGVGKYSFQPTKYGLTFEFLSTGQTASEWWAWELMALTASQ